VQKVASTSLDTAKLYQEMQKAKEELRISENKGSRLLLHLQQNVKLLTSLATNEGETTIVQEAAQNIASLSSLSVSIAPHYLRDLKRALGSKHDPLAGIEILELLKQEIAINSILRRQTEQLSGTADRLFESVRGLKESFENQRPDRNLMGQITRYEAILNQISGALKCSVGEIEGVVKTLLEESAGQRRSFELLKKKLTEESTKCAEQSNEIEILRHQIREREDSESRGQKVRMALMKELGVSVKAATEFDALIFGASRAIPIIQSHRSICNIVQADHARVVNEVERLVDENVTLRRAVEQDRNLMASQAETIQTLQERNWKKWGIEVAGSLMVDNPESLGDAELQEVIASRLSAGADSAIDHDSDLFEPEAQFSQLTAVSEKLNSIEKELESLQHQILSGNDI
jgi:hypothetical protein